MNEQIELTESQVAMALGRLLLANLTLEKRVHVLAARLAQPEPTPPPDGGA